MSVAAMFQAASTRDLTGLVPANPANPPVSAFPTFTLPVPQDHTSHELAVIRAADAVVRAVALGPGSTQLSAWHESDVPAVFRAANTLVEPDAAVPTFNVNRSGVKRYMNLIVFKSASIVRHAVERSSLNVTAADLGDVPRMMKKAQEWAVSQRSGAAFPTFRPVTDRDGNPTTHIEIIHVTRAEVASGQVRGPAAWTFFDLAVAPQRLAGYLVTEWTIAGPSGQTVLLVNEKRMLNQYDGSAPTFASAPLPADRRTVDDGKRREGNLFGLSAAQAENTLHVLHYDGFLVHASRAADSTSSEWRSRVVDGDGMSGHFNGSVGYQNTLVNRPTPAGAELHAFYFTGSTDDSRLRHAQFDGTDTWKTEELDGSGMDNAGRVQADLNYGICALAEPDGRLHVFYHDVTKENLRHAWIGVGGTWAFEVLDGSGGTSPPPGGQGTGPISGKVGSSPSAVLFDGRLYVFYDDSVNGNIRMAVRRTEPAGEVWSFHVLDGSHWTGGTVTRRVQESSAVVWNDRLSVLYQDSDQGHLRHAYLVKGPGAWRFETLDGAGGAAGRVTDNVGIHPVAYAAGLANGQPGLPLAVAYLNNDKEGLRWALLDEPILLL